MSAATSGAERASSRRGEPRYPLDRAANAFLYAHLALIAFVTAAMITVLVGDLPVWMRGEYSATVYTFGWQYSGQVYIVLGACAALLHSATRFGWARAFALFTVASGVALLSELAGTNLGLPFGPYRYTEMLGYRIAGDVPYAIPISWYYMLYCGLAFCARLLAADDSSATKWRWALLAGAFLTAWDVAMEVQMTSVAPAHWVWELERMPGWVPSWISAPFFYGMPLSNWMGWLATGIGVSRLMLAIVPPSVWRTTTVTALLPVVLYASNGIMPIATTARHGLWGAALLGLLAMGLPIWMVVRARHGERVALGATLTTP